MDIIFTTIPFPCKTPSQNPLKQNGIAGRILESNPLYWGPGIQFDRALIGNNLRNFKFSDINGVIPLRFPKKELIYKPKPVG